MKILLKILPKRQIIWEQRSNLKNQLLKKAKRRLLLRRKLNLLPPPHLQKMKMLMLRNPPLPRNQKAKRRVGKRV
jgi:hypothetical protein